MTLSKCLQQHGVKVPAQSLAGTNPGFNTNGLDTATPVFKQCYKVALRKWAAILHVKLVRHRH